LDCNIILNLKSVDFFFLFADKPFLFMALVVQGGTFDLWDSSRFCFGKEELKMEDWGKRFYRFLVLFSSSIRLNLIGLVWF
jgi:hypothetical protein